MKPVLFNTEMVRAILGGRKTVTRRVIKPQPLDKPRCFHDEEEGLNIMCHVAGRDRLYNYFPPHQSGDILYVRETWALVPDAKNDPLYRYCYRADNEDILVERWHPSIHMPKEAARIFLRVTDMRVERLQATTNDGAVDEGAVRRPHYVRYGGEKCLALHDRYRVEFAAFWDSTIKPKDRAAYGWEANPWVWVIEFERVSRETALAEGALKYGENG